MATSKKAKKKQPPMQPLVRDDGKVRFQGNSIAQFLLDWATSRGVGMTELALMKFDDRDREQFAQLIGYDLDGYGELPYVSRVSYAKALMLAEKLPRKGK